MPKWRGREVTELKHGGVAPGTPAWEASARFHTAIGQLVHDWAVAMDDFTYAVEGEYACCILRSGTWMCQVWLTMLDAHSPQPTVTNAISKLWAATALVRRFPTIEDFAQHWRAEVDDIRELYIEYVDLAAAAMILHPDFGDEERLRAYTDGLEDPVQ